MRLETVGVLLFAIATAVALLARSFKVPCTVALVIVTVARAAVVFLALTSLPRTSERMPWRWGVVLPWGGLRGALSMVLALALPVAFPGRQLVVTMTFGVVILSIVACGLTTAPLLRRLRVAGTS